MNTSHTIFVLFGSTGDLSKRKLFGSLYNLYKQDTGRKIDIIAVGRRDFTKQQFCEYIDLETTQFIDKEDRQKFDQFLSTVDYSKVEITNKEDYKSLDSKILEIYGPESQIVVYLSIGYNLFETVIKGLGGLEITKSRIKVVFEKPFGKDLKSAESLNSLISLVFSEEQIYRIDHYVGKSGVQDILKYRDQNKDLLKIWNSENIDSIQIIASEKIGVQDRGDYYEESGALRDMVQNHLFQVMSMVLMNLPTSWSSKEISHEKLQVLQSVDIKKSDVVYGQYEGYTQEKNVSPTSGIETFVALKLFVTVAGFNQIPVYIKTGKGLESKQTVAVVTFKKGTKVELNLTEGVQVIDSNLIFNLNSKKDESYTNLILQCILGDKSLFTDWSILKQSWSKVEELVNCQLDCPIIHKYSLGSNGPIESEILVLSENREWIHGIG